MAKKQKKTTKVEEPVVVKEEVVTTNRSSDIRESYKELQNTKTKEKTKERTKGTKLEDNWVIKDRVYYLRNKKSPLTHIIKAADIYYFDEEKGYQRELKYTRNQQTPFVDEMKGEQRLEHIIFEKGNLFVPKQKTVLQKLLSLYHPHKDILFEEYKPIKQAASEIDYFNIMKLLAPCTIKHLSDK